MPNSDTFTIPPISEFVNRYIAQSKTSVDCFARNQKLCVWTNDLNKNTTAEYHMDVLDFLRHIKACGVKSDCVVFDPPYSPRQIKECYDSVGLTCRKETIQRQCGWTRERKLIRDILTHDGIVLSFGWNSVGMGKGFEIKELLLVCHGGGHNDTICIAEKRLPDTIELL